MMPCKLESATLGLVPITVAFCGPVALLGSKLTVQLRGGTRRFSEVK